MSDRSPQAIPPSAGARTRAGFSILLLVTLLLVVAPTGGLEPPMPVPQVAAPAEKWLNFEGNLNATGTTRVLAMGGGREAKTFYFSGSLFMVAGEGLSRGFRIEIVGYDDGSGHSVGSCVWTDDRGDKVLSEIRGDSIGTTRHIVGTITGGTGRYSGLVGEYDFHWRYVVLDEEGVIQGQATGLKGRFHRVAQAQGKASP